MQLDYELLSSLINEDRIIQEIKAIKVSKSDADVKELVESLLSSLAMIKKTKSSYTKRQALAKLVKIHQILKNTISKEYSRELYDITKSLSIVYVIYFLTESEVGEN